MDYARGNREILGNESFFLLPWRGDAESHAVTRNMKEIAPVNFYRSAEEREHILGRERADFFYCIKNGFNDGVFSARVRTGIHAIFRESEFHGDVYAYVSPWLSEVMAYGQAPWVPHMVRLSEDAGCLRAEIGIPKDAMVFGRHGGDDSFDIPWVQQAVKETAKKNPEIWFLFLNTREFPGAAGLPNIRFLPATADPVRKRRFLNSCDAMLHGRMRGETFGLSCLEFAMLGKPVLTYAGSPETAHVEILGDVARRYENAKQLKELLAGAGLFGPGKGRRMVKGHNPEGATCNGQPIRISKTPEGRFRQYQPEDVMRKFEQVFLR